METDRTARVGGVSGILGGVFWVISTVLHASKPVGCVAQECATRDMRETSAIEGVLTGTALLLFVVTAWALVVLVRRGGQFGTLGRAGTLLAVTGVFVLMVAGVVQAVLFAGDFPFMPYFVIPGIVLLVVGFALLAITILRARVLPTYAPVALLAGVMSMAVANEQTATAWLAIPFGLGWLVVGFALLRHAKGASASSAPLQPPQMA